MLSQIQREAPVGIDMPFEEYCSGTPQRPVDEFRRRAKLTLAEAHPMLSYRCSIAEAQLDPLIKCPCQMRVPQARSPDDRFASAR